MPARTLPGLLLLMIALGAGAAQLPVTIDDAWVRTMPPGIERTAGYLAIENHTGEPVSLEAVHSRDFERVEIHESVEDDGSVSMRQHESVAVAGGETVTFRPGGLHLMLIEPRDPERVQSGELVHLRFEFSNGQTIELDTVVRRQSESATGRGENE